MRRFGQRVLVWSIVLSFAVFFGVELATRGISDTGGPAVETGVREVGEVVTADDLLREMQRDAELEAKETAETAAEAQAETDVSAHPPSAGSALPPQAGSDNVVEGLANTTGRLLRVTAQGGVEFVVGLLDGILN